VQVESPSEGVHGDVEVALLDVARRAEALFVADGGVGVTLMVADRPVFVASNPFGAAVDAIQYRLSEGPCVMAAETQDVVWSGTIGAGERRWPCFVAQIAPLGLGSVLSVPIVSHDESIGSLNLYARARHTFDGADAASVGQVVGSVAGDLESLHLKVAAEAAAVELATVVRDRAEVDVAVGILMDRYVLRSRAARVLLSQLARQDGASEAASARRLIDEAGSGEVGPAGSAG
jgi:GAF domain-containing protein